MVMSEVVFFCQSVYILWCFRSRPVSVPLRVADSGSGSSGKRSDSPSVGRSVDPITIY